MTADDHRRLARELAAYEAKQSARSVTYWLDTMELEGQDRIAVLDIYKRGEESE